MLDTDINVGNIVNFNTDVDGPQQGKVTDKFFVNGVPMIKVVKVGGGDVFYLNPADIDSIKPKSAREFRKEAQFFLKGKPGMSKAEQHAAVVKAIEALHEAEVILAVEAQNEADAKPALTPVADLDHMSMVKQALQDEETQAAEEMAAFENEV